MRYEKHDVRLKWGLLHFVKTMKRDYIAFMPKPDAATAVRNLAIEIRSNTHSSTIV